MNPTDTSGLVYRYWRDSDEMLPLLAKCDLLYVDPHTTPTPELTLLRQAGRVVHQCPELKDRLHLIIESDMSHETKMAELGAAQWLLDRNLELNDGSFISQVTDNNCVILNDGSFNLAASALLKSLPFTQRAGHKLLASKLGLGRSLFKEIQKPIYVHSSMEYLIGKNPSTAAKRRACLQTLFDQKGILGFFAQNFPLHLYCFLKKTLLKGSFSIDGTPFDIPKLLFPPATISDLLTVYMNLLCYNYESGIYDKHEFIELLMMHMPNLPKNTLLTFKQELITHFWFDDKGAFLFKEGNVIQLKTFAHLQQALCSLSLCVKEKYQYELHGFLASNAMTTTLACYVAAKSGGDLEACMNLGLFTLPKKTNSTYSAFELMLRCHCLRTACRSAMPLQLLNFLGSIKQRDVAIFIHGPKIQFLFYPTSSFSKNIMDHLKIACQQLDSSPPLFFRYFTSGKQQNWAKTAKMILQKNSPEQLKPIAKTIDDELTQMSQLKPVIVGELEDGSLLVTKYNFASQEMSFYRQTENRLSPIDFSYFKQLEVLSPI